MDPGHGNAGKVTEGKPSSSILSTDGVAMINMKAELEVGIGLFKKPDRFLILHPDTHLTRNRLCQVTLRVFLFLQWPIWEFPQSP